MPNLRLTGINTTDPRVIIASFSDNLDPLIGIGNIVIASLNVGVPNPQVLEIKIRNNLLTITITPMVTAAPYRVTFQSTDAVPFKNVNGDAFLFEDGATNIRQIFGPEETINEIRNNLVSFLSKNIYNLQRGTLVRFILDAIATDLLRGRNTIRQLKSDNYLNSLITDERKVRGRGASDRLNEEGAFEVLRVGKTPTNAELSLAFSFDSFPFDQITLLRTDVTAEKLSAGASNLPGTFENLLLTVNNGSVTKLNSVTINYQDGYTFEYPIPTYGYRINEPKYDTQFASTLLTLADNQFLLGENVLNDPGFIRVPGGGDTITIDYEYKSLGRYVDPDTVEVTQILEAVREPTPALINEFSLDHAPIVTSGGKTATSGGVTFLDPNSATPFKTIHPAFTIELPFNLGGLPSAPGEYAVDYATGRVVVFGADDTQDGTGPFPPAATYNYQNSFRSGLDYTHDPDTNDLVANPLRDLIRQTARISFNYEQVLVPDVDYRALVHQESINERIENRLRTTNSLFTNNGPVTNVFRIFNETTGEVYGLSRFRENIVYFTANTPPRILTANRERVKFTNELNELLVVVEELTNSLGTRIFRIPLLNNRIMSVTEDVIGSSYNTSVSFSRNAIFQQELFFDGQDLIIAANIARLLVGQYQIDYRNGVVYVGVSSDQTFDIGTINYKKSVIDPKNSHIISVSNLYHSLAVNLDPAKTINYVGFEDGAVTPSSFDVSDERYLNGDTSLPYIVSSDTITVTNDIRNVRHIFDLFDLNNNVEPVDFAPSATFQSNVITLDEVGIEQRETLVVGAGLTVTVSTISPGIVLNTANSILRLSDNIELLDGYETISGNVITLAISSGAVVGDVVEVIYTVIMTSAATPIVDYDRGEYFMDYTYLADEILVSYEYGDNVIDFSNSTSVEETQEYFVTYRFGALRDALLSNFGNLVDIPEAQTFDTELDREIYRDALSGALQSFTKGPTIPAMEQLVSNVTKITPEIIEAVFDIWSLGISHLFLEPPKLVGEPELLPGKFDNGIRIAESGQSVTFPVSSNLRLEEGTLEFWAIPEWDGLDNDATLAFSNLKRDGYALSASQIFIGASSFNPTIEDGEFSVNKLDDSSPVGLPAAVFTQTGMFIFFDDDNKRWRILAKDRPKDGYDGYVYSGTIFSSGEVYDVKFIQDLGEPGDVLRSDLGRIDFEFNLNVRDKVSPDGYTTGDGYITGFSFDGITFMADDFHYLFDFAEESDKNRFSIYKDGSGYLNFSIWDRGGVDLQKKMRRNNYRLSADIQDWKAGEKHHIAAAWKLDTHDHRDEMHLFVDGFEVPNILRYGGRPVAATTDRFRTVKPETVVGTVTKKSIVGNDLNTFQGSSQVSSITNDFEGDGIVPGDTIRIDEPGFTSYNIIAVNGSVLTLDSVMPATLTDANFAVNIFNAIVSSQIDLFANIAVSVVRNSEEIEIPGLRADIPSYEVNKTAFNENVLTVLGNLEPGDTILIRTLGLNFRRAKETVFIWGDTQAVLKTQLPPPINLDEVSIRPVLFPLEPIGASNSAIVLGNFVATGLPITQPTNSTEGRTLEVRITGGNVDFTTPTSVTIFGTTTGPPSETLVFTEPGTQQTTLKFLTTTSVSVTTKPFTTVQDGTAVEIKEAFPITFPDGNVSFPVLRFAVKTQLGTSLEGDGSDIVSDPNGFFPQSDVGNLLVINSPALVAGTFTITQRISNTSVRVSPAPAAAFSGGNYDIFSISIGRSGFQNGFFFVQEAGTSTTGYPLPEGFYEFDYSAYLEVPFDPVTQEAHIGSDFLNQQPADAIIDELRISSNQLTDTRVGETLGVNEESITTSFFALNEFRKNNNTLMLLHFNEFPLENDADFVVFANREFVQSSRGVNDKFGESIVITEKGLSFDNKGTLTTNNEGSIEFWISPRFDTYNDPVRRFYFDAIGAVVEDVVSLTKGTVQVSGRISEIISVRLQTDSQETGEDFFAGSGEIADDRQTITLKKALPFQQTPVRIVYIPSGLKGDRISIYKDTEGFIVFNVRAQGEDIQVRTPVFWPRDTWHRVRAMFKFNRTDNLDEIRLFVDSEERGVILFGSGLIFGDGTIFGQTTVGVTNQILITDINFTDPITRYFIGSDFLGVRTAQARIDNFRLSNISRNPITVAGQPLDPNFSSNLMMSFPVIEDAFTTFLLNFERIIQETDDFATLRDEVFGIFNFTINILDSFGIVGENERIRELLESLILALKPGNAKVQINLIR